MAETQQAFIEPATTLADRLKAETWPLHQQAEKHPYMGATMRGGISRDLYARELQQRLILHTALEAALRTASAKDPAVAAVFKAYHERVPHLRSDLQAFDTAPGTPVPVTAAMVARIESDALSKPWRLLGYLYVLEGSTNGAKYIAKALAKGLNIPDARGLSYQDPHGDLLRERWSQFRTDIAGVTLTDDQQRDVITAADAMFRYSIDLFDALTA